MGNISNLWYLKDNGGSWCDTKCGIDLPYKIPYKNGDDLYMEVRFDLPGVIAEAWVVNSITGDRLFDIIGGGDYRIIEYSSTDRLVAFKMPTFGDGECPYIQTGTVPGCCVDMNVVYSDPITADLAADFLANDPDVNIVLIPPVGLPYYINQGQLPTGVTWPDDPSNRLLFYVDCDFPGGWSFGFQKDPDPTIYGGAWGLPEECGEPIPVYSTVKCFHFEIPLHEDGRETNTIVSEPFECGGCNPSVVIHSDYCLQQTDINGTWLFNFENQGEEQFGGMTETTNHMRIPAVLKKLPSKLSFNRNIKCNNFKSKKVDRYKLQGGSLDNPDFPDYMLNVIESIMSGKKFYVNDEEYIIVAEEVFTERGVPGWSGKRLDLALEKCEKGMVFPCKCEPEPPNCEENPVTGFVFGSPLPDQNPEYGVNRVYWKVGVAGLSGGVPPYVVSDWQFFYGDPDNTFEGFDPNALTNIYKRNTYEPGFISVLCNVTDSRGCTYGLGNTIVADDLRCVEDAGFFEVQDNWVGGIPGAVRIVNVAPTGLEYEYSLDNISYFPTGEISPDPYVITGLPSGEVITVFVRVKCNEDELGHIGAYVITVP